MLTKNKSMLALGVYSFLTLMFIVTSFYQADAEVYIFPRIIAVIMGVLILIMWFKAMKTGVDDMEASNINWKSLLPGFLIGVGYVLILESVGFYVSSFLAFFLIISFYGVRHALHAKALLVKLGISLLFMGCIYLLFGKLLNVITPAGVLF